LVAALTDFTGFIQNAIHGPDGTVIPELCTQQRIG
jgi:hypothetical protein